VLFRQVGLSKVLRWARLGLLDMQQIITMKVSNSTRVMTYIVCRWAISWISCTAFCCVCSAASPWYNGCLLQPLTQHFGQRRQQQAADSGQCNQQTLLQAIYHAAA
jgi:hypothetical protein